MPLKAGGAQNQTPGSTRAYAIGEKPLPHIQETRGAHLWIVAGDTPASVMWGSDQHGGGPPASGATQITAPPAPHTARAGESGTTSLCCGLLML